MHLGMVFAGMVLTARIANKFLFTAAVIQARPLESRTRRQWQKREDSSVTCVSRWACINTNPCVLCSSR